MKILAIDTSSLACSAALTDGGKLLGEKIINTGLTHSETLMPAVQQMLEGESLTVNDIDLFAAVAGPGSFTGVRIGVCAVKALCLAAGRPCARVDAMEALAEGAAFEGLICPIYDARRQQVYTALFEKQNGVPARLTEDEAKPLEEVLSGLPGDGKVYFTGDGLDTYEAYIREKLGERAVIAPGHSRVLRASAACAVASRLEPMDGEMLTPVYLRLSQAERERSEKLTRAKL